MRNWYQQYLLRYNRSKSKLWKLERKLEKKSVSSAPFNVKQLRKIKRAIERVRLQISYLRLSLEKAVAAGVIGVAFFASVEAKAQVQFNFEVADTSEVKFVAVPYERADESKPTFGDIDADGDFDLFIGRSDGRVDFFENVGDSTLPIFELKTGEENPLDTVRGLSYTNITFSDLDNDGDLDVFATFSVDEYDSEVKEYWNNGSADSAVFGSAQSPGLFRDLAFSGYSQLTLADLDGDGDMDAIGADGYYGDIYYYKNVGRKDSAAFEGQPGQLNPFNDWDFGEEPKFSFADVDNDMDVDVIVGNGDGNLFFYENTTTEISSPLFTLNNEAIGFLADSSWGSYIKPEFVDLDGDKDMDLVLGTSDTAYIFFINKLMITGNHEPSNQVAFEVFPNPSVDHVNIDSEEEIERIRLLSTSGQLMTYGSLANSEVSLRDYPAGVYFIEVKTVDGKISRKLINKM